MLMIRNLNREDLPELLELCNLSLHKDFITMHTMLRCTFEDPNFTPEYTLALWKGGRMAAAVIGAKRTAAPPDAVDKQRDIAWIKMLCAAPGEHDLTLKRLLEKFEKLVVEDGKTRIRATDFASWHLWPGIDLDYENYLSILMSSGYHKVGEAVDYHIDLGWFRVPRRVREIEKKLSRKGIKVRRIGESETEQIIDWVKKNFSSFWAYEAAEGVKRGRKVFAAFEAGEIIGFSVYGALEHNWFGPIGVLKEKRHHGLGTVLLFRTLEAMRLEGVRLAVIPWTGHLFFYTQVPGIVGIRHYWTLEKIIKQ